ncbi:hypothetical protein Q5P01_024972 [Channa striata]|uniref:Uncharacterized protein n=1 Tax=Channa striata TaxID=64152 RepID=A0AA88IRI6_CHASR|nr:hypothetical protein Q5P01_024972 [Channa striata]
MFRSGLPSPTARANSSQRPPFRGILPPSCPLARLHPGAADRFRGKLGAAIASVITSLIVGFLTMPNNILYFIDSRHGTRGSAVAPGGRPAGQAVRSAYIHARHSPDHPGLPGHGREHSAQLLRCHEQAPRWATRSEASKSTRTVFACLIVMSVELFMSVVAGCMELLYRPLIQGEHRLHNMECAIAVFNIVIAMRCHHGPPSTVLKEKQGEVARAAA